MNPIIKKAVDAQGIATAAQEYATRLMRQAQRMPVPKKLREADINDLLIKGNVVWYPADDGQKWQIVYHGAVPEIGQATFGNKEGARFGLYGAYIEVTDERQRDAE